jgi:WhiB family redox-sensing transcriptional regulator
MSWGDWRDQANCQGHNPDMFFPAVYENATAAKQICASCVVRDTCLEYALEHNLQHGIWGGVSIHERRAMRRRRLKAAS